MADEDVRVEERPHRRALARFRQVSVRIRDHDEPRFPGGTGTLPASSKNSDTLASTARSRCTRNRTRSPVRRPRASRTGLGNVICPFDVTVAPTSTWPTPYSLPEVRIQDGARFIQQVDVLAVSEIGHSTGRRQPVGMLRQRADMNTSPTESPAITAIRMTMGHWVAQCVFVACELRIPDLVAGGPRTADELASETGADPVAMLRLLRALASLDGLPHPGDGGFEAAPLSERFRQGVP